MSCEHCVNGLRPLEWTDAKPGDLPDFAVCLCPAGQAYRRGENEGRRTVALWRVWCAVHQVDPSRVRLIEDIWSAEELAAAGLTMLAAAGPASRAAALLAKGRRTR